MLLTRSRCWMQNPHGSEARGEKRREMKSLSRLSRHYHYRELCALASVGELSREDLCKLKEHLNTCARCREVYSNYEKINAALLPDVSDEEETILGLEASTRAIVLDSIAAVRISDPTPYRVPAGQSNPTPSGRVFSGLQWSAGFLLIAGFFFVVGMGYEVFQFHRLHTTGVGSPNTQQAAKSRVMLDSNALTKPDQPSAVESKLRDALRSEEQHDADLQASLAAREKELLAAERANADLRATIAEHEQEFENTRTLLTSKSAELERVRASADSDQATLVELKYKVQELTDRLNTESADIERERNLLSKGREIRDIIGARNLHIVDVYDADSKGHTKRPFARAFYTEGKSLVFYAYDLPGQHADAKLTYVAWGQKNGQKSSIRNLGILVDDDQGQKRWSLNFTDPQVLAEIDSVFITLEPSGNTGQPSGKRMLTAYLNDAVNHP